MFHVPRYVGCSATAYFLAKCTAHIPLILLSPAVYVCDVVFFVSTHSHSLSPSLTHLLLSPPASYLTFYYTFSSPRAPLYTYYGCFVLVELVGTGVGYMVPLLFKGRAQLAGVVFPLVCTMFSGVSPTIEKLDEMGPVSVHTALAWSSGCGEKRRSRYSHLPSAELCLCSRGPIML